MSSALDFSHIREEIISVEKKTIHYMLHPETIFMLIWLSAIPSSTLIYTYSPALWSMING